MAVDDGTTAGVLDMHCALLSLTEQSFYSSPPGRLTKRPHPFPSTRGDRGKQLVYERVPENADGQTRLVFS